MLVISGSPSLVSANSRKRVPGDRRGHPQRLLAEHGQRETGEQVRAGGAGRHRHDMPGGFGLCSSPSMPPSASVRAREGHSARSSAGILKVAQSAAAAARPYSGAGPLLASPKCPLTR